MSCTCRSCRMMDDVEADTVKAMNKLTDTFVTSPPGVTGLSGSGNQKPTTLRDITGNADADKVFLSDVASRTSSTKWAFNIETVAAPGQMIWMMEDNKVVTKTVHCTRIHIKPNPKKVEVNPFGFTVEYALDTAEGCRPIWTDQSLCFASKEDLLASL